MEDAAAADERLVDLEVGVLGGGADKDDRAVLHPGQQRVLLRLVKAMYLVDKEDGALAVEAGAFLRLGHGLANLLDAGEHRVERDEVGAGGVGDDPRQCRLARARWAIEDQAAQLVGLDGAAQQPPRADDVLLADVLGQSARAHACSQRRILLHPFSVGLVEEVGCGVHGKVRSA
ncbi:MAG: hypothetical protein V9G19_10830 [Tetrasphaera sp.]